MKTPSCRFENLPRDLFTQCTNFLPGSDLLSLSHVNHVLLTELLAPNGSVWTRRVSTTFSRRESAKQRYATSRSFRFSCTTREGGRRPEERGGAIALPSFVASACGQSSFSMSLWFALEASPPLVIRGGILLGSQSVHFSDPWGEHSHQQFIHVDPEGNLYCSVTSTKEVVARLEPGRWYHLVLTYERSDDGNGVQSVYLDRKRVDSTTGELHSEWSDLSDWQLGSGCISGGAKGEPSRGYCGWYGFSGLIDDFTVWCRVLSTGEVERVLRGDRVADPFVEYALQDEKKISQIYGDVKLVCCSRPQERLL